MDGYKQIFDCYVTEMRAAQSTANEWWQALLRQETKLTRNTAAAEATLESRWPMGAVSHPAVIATFRKWALQCQQLNDEADEEDEEDDGDESDWGIEDEDDDEADDLAALEAPVEPRDLLIEMLTGRADDLSEFLANFVFTPLGLDKNDRWI